MLTVTAPGVGPRHRIIDIGIDGPSFGRALGLDPGTLARLSEFSRYHVWFPLYGTSLLHHWLNNCWAK